MLHAAPRRRRASLQARQHPFLERLEAGDRARADVPLGDGVVGDDVGLVAGLGEHAVDALVGLDVLAQGGHRVVAEHGGVEGVAAPVGEGGGMGLLAEVLDLPGGDGDDVHLEQVETRGMDHHRRVDTLEGARLGHEDLAPAAFLGRGTEDEHPAPDLVGQGRGRQPGAEAGGGDDVVAAPVADAG